MRSRLCSDRSTPRLSPSPSLSVDGAPGVATREAVIRFQPRERLAAARRPSTRGRARPRLASAASERQGRPRCPKSSTRSRSPGLPADPLDGPLFGVDPEGGRRRRRQDGRGRLGQGRGRASLEMASMTKMTTGADHRPTGGEGPARARRDRHLLQRSAPTTPSGSGRRRRPLGEAARPRAALRAPAPLGQRRGDGLRRTLRRAIPQGRRA